MPLRFLNAEDKHRLIPKREINKVRLLEANKDFRIFGKGNSEF
jgi:hypothetical protein